MKSKRKKRLLRYFTILVPAFYSASLALIVLYYFWNGQSFELWGCNALPIILCGIFGFTGIYLLLSIRNKKEVTKLESEVQDLTLELKEQTAIADKASRAKIEFLTAMSHDIRTPLNAVIGLSEIELRGSLSEASRENITQIHQSGSSLLEFINALLDTKEETAWSPKNDNYTSNKREDDFILYEMPDCRALVVDDLPMNLMVARGLLVPYGMTVDTAESGLEAIEKVRRSVSLDEEYDLIFMDHLMPEMDGIEALKAISAIDGYDNVPVIALTANALRGMREYYVEQGFKDYLSKPINPKSLNDVIIRWIPQKFHQISKQKPKTEETSSQANIAVEIDAQRLDMLNHYRVSFESGRLDSSQSEVDWDYFKRFTALVESLNMASMAASVQEQAALLKEAGQQGDAQKIREALPAFYAALRKQREIEEQEKGQGQKTLVDILPRLKKAILAGKAGEAEVIMKELGTESLGSSGRELYFLLYDFLLADDTEKALGAISLWEKLYF